MAEISREQLHAYLDDALSEAESAQIERALRESEALQNRLRLVMQERDRGEHSLGAIWRRHRLTCPSREQLGSFLLDVLDQDWAEYLRFHLDVVGCPYCTANLIDLKSLQQESPTTARQRRQRFYHSSAGYLHTCQDTQS